VRKLKAKLITKRKNYVRGHTRLWRETLEHWRCNLDLLVLNYYSGLGQRKKNKVSLVTDMNINQSNCSFCFFFLDHGCLSCPVYKRTHATGCLYTPYNSVYFWLRKARNEKMSRKKLFEEGFKVISDEINFLLSLKD